MPTLTDDRPGRNAEIERQSAKDEEYRRACRQAGIEPHVEKQGSSIEYQADYTSASYTIDIAEVIDQTVDMLIEKHGHPEVVRDVVRSLEAPMKKESERTQAGVVAKVVCYIVKGERGNLLARIHGLMHAIPRMAAAEGIGSMAQSAKMCGVSREWMRATRDSWIHVLGIPVPVEGTKSEEAKAKYKHLALTQHHTRRKLIAA